MLLPTEPLAVAGAILLSDDLGPSNDYLRSVIRFTDAAKAVPEGPEAVFPEMPYGWAAVLGCAAAGILKRRGAPITL